MMKLSSGSPGITRILVGSRGTLAQTRFPNANPGSSLIPCCAEAPAWQPETAQVGEKMFTWIEARVGSSGPPGAAGVDCVVPPLAQLGATACPKGTPFSSSPCPSPAPQAASRSKATAAPARKRLRNHLTRAQAGRAHVLGGRCSDLPANLAAPVHPRMDVEVQVARAEVGEILIGHAYRRV